MSSHYANKRLEFTLFGQSHAQCVGAVVSGLPVGMELDETAIAAFMARRAPGRDPLSTARRETDAVQFVSGVMNGRVCDAPLTLMINNQDAKPADYSQRYRVPRPGHGDYPLLARFGQNADIRGGGHRSGRITAAVCAVGALCMQALEYEKRNIKIGAHIYSLGGERDTPFDPVCVSGAELAAPGAKAFPVLNDEAGARMAELILAAKREGDSLGGVVEAAAAGVPAGIGEPFFDSLDAVLARLFFALPGVKGFEMGAGFGAAAMLGSENNDGFYFSGERVLSKSNSSGGVLGGRASGMPIIARAAFKPTPSIAKKQQSADLACGAAAELEISGRHDPTIAVRAVPVAEAVMAIALFDLI